MSALGKITVRSIFDLTTEEAWRILAELLGEEIPSLEAVQNEDWGRDYILQKLLSLPPHTLGELGLYIPNDSEQDTED